MVEKLPLTVRSLSTKEHRGLLPRNLVILHDYIQYCEKDVISNPFTHPSLPPGHLTRILTEKTPYFQKMDIAYAVNVSEKLNSWRVMISNFFNSLKDHGLRCLSRLHPVTPNEAQVASLKECLYSLEDILLALKVIFHTKHL